MKAVVFLSSLVSVVGAFSSPAWGPGLKFAPVATDFDAPIERQIAVGNVVRRDEDVAYTIGFGRFGTMRVPKFIQKSLHLKNKRPGWSLDRKHVNLMNLDDECYLGKNCDVSKGCVDFDPIHTSDGKLLAGTESASSSSDLHILYSSF